MDQNFSDFNKHSKFSTVLTGVGIVVMLMSMVLLLYIQHNKQNLLTIKEKAITAKDEEILKMSKDLNLLKKDTITTYVQVPTQKVLVRNKYIYKYGKMDRYFLHGRKLIDTTEISYSNVDNRTKVLINSISLLLAKNKKLMEKVLEPDIRLLGNFKPSDNSDSTLLLYIPGEKGRGLVLPVSWDRRKEKNNNIFSKGQNIKENNKDKTVEQWIKSIPYTENARQDRTFDEPPLHASYINLFEKIECYVEPINDEEYPSNKFTITIYMADRSGVPIHAYNEDTKQHILFKKDSSRTNSYSYSFISTKCPQLTIYLLHLGPEIVVYDYNVCLNMRYKPGSVKSSGK